jgi:methyltransferase (TIGR00027 family)|nr:SAM-dependent methyltransferase [Candidatus Acidoferrales bacterium]
MHEAKPSRTAFRVAIRRAAHQIYDTPRVLDDALAVRIIGAEYAARIAAGVAENSGLVSKSLRAFLVARSRYAEDELARAVADGVRQYVVLGAGLDTFAYRNPYAQPSSQVTGLRVFEVDHPATQEWKREQLRAAAINIPPETVFVPVNFERETIADGLQRVGFSTHDKTMFSWLGVTPYLTDRAFTETISFIASMPTGSGVVFDYAVPRASLKFIERLVFDRISARVKTAGEPFQLFLDPKHLAARLHQIGFTHLEDLGVDEINARYFAGRSDKLRVRGALGRMISARK